MDRLIAVSRDITERHQHEAQLLSLIAVQNTKLSDSDLYLEEIHHQVKNSLHLVNTLLQLQANLSADEAVKIQLQTAASRVLTIASVHERLYQTAETQGVLAPEYLGALLSDLGSALAERKIVLDADAFILPPQRMAPLGLVISELIHQCPQVRQGHHRRERPGCRRPCCHYGKGRGGGLSGVLSRTKRNRPGHAAGEKLFRVWGQCNYAGPAGREQYDLCEVQAVGSLESALARTALPEWSVDFPFTAAGKTLHKQMMAGGSSGRISEARPEGAGLRLRAIKPAFLEFRHNQLDEILQSARTGERVQHVTTGSRNAGVLLDTVGDLLRRSYQYQICTACDVGRNAS